MPFLGETDCQPGDILAFSSPTPLGWAIRITTLGRYNHVGIVGSPPTSRGIGELVFYESTADATEACLLREKRVIGVQAHPLAGRIRAAQDAGQRLYHLPLIRPLTRREQAHLLLLCLDKLGTPYDFTGALRARTLGFGWVRWILPNREDTGDLFCSEFATLMLRILKRFNTRNCSAWSPAPLIRALVHRGVTEEPRLLGRDGA